MSRQFVHSRICHHFASASCGRTRKEECDWEPCRLRPVAVVCNVAAQSRPENSAKLRVVAVVVASGASLRWSISGGNAIGQSSESETAKVLSPTLTRSSFATRTVNCTQQSRPASRFIISQCLIPSSCLRPGPSRANNLATRLLAAGSSASGTN